MTPKKTLLGSSPEHPLLAERAYAGDFYNGWPCKSQVCGLLVRIPEIPPTGDDVYMECGYCGTTHHYRLRDKQSIKCDQTTPPQQRASAPRRDLNRLTPYESAREKLYPKKPPQ